MNEDNWFGMSIILNENVVCITDSLDQQHAEKQATEWLGKIYQEAIKEIENEKD